MPRIVITHAVKDVPRWLAGKAERATALPGVTNVTDVVATDGSKHAGVVFDVERPRDTARLHTTRGSRASRGTRGDPADDRLRRGVGKWRSK